MNWTDVHVHNFLPGLKTLPVERLNGSIDQLDAAFKAPGIESHSYRNAVIYEAIKSIAGRNETGIQDDARQQSGRIRQLLPNIAGFQEFEEYWGGAPNPGRLLILCDEAEVAWIIGSLARGLYTMSLVIFVATMICLAVSTGSVIVHSTAVGMTGVLYCGVGLVAKFGGLHLF